MRITLLAGIFLLLAGTSWAQDPVNSDSKAQLTQNEVIEIAKAAAQAEKIGLSKFNMESCHYDISVQGNHTWTVYFTQKMPMPEGDFSVRVDDQTKKATLNRGL